MKKLTCEMCGSTDLIKKDGVFVCQFCDCKYSVEEAKKIMFEGAVEITKGEVEKERLLKNAEIFINLNDEQKAEALYLQLTDYYPDDYRGWLGITRLTMKKILGIIKNISLELTSDDLFKPFHSECEAFMWLIKELNWVGEKISYLDSEIYECIEQFEGEIISTYYDKGFNPINPISLEIVNNYNVVPEWSNRMQQWASEIEKNIICYYEKNKQTSYNPLSASILTNYARVKTCSPQIQTWANKLVDEYISDYKGGKVSVLIWQYMSESHLELELKSKPIYPAAIQMCRLGFNIAKKVNDLAQGSRKKLLRTWGLDNTDHLLSDNEHLYFVLGNNISFWSRYGEYSFVKSINRCITLENIDAEIQNILSTDLGMICENCGGMIDLLGFCKECNLINKDKQPLLCKNLLSMLNNMPDKYSECVELNRRFSKLTWYHGRGINESYWFTEVTTTQIVLSRTSIIGSKRYTSEVGRIIYGSNDFKNIYIYVLKKANKCQYCGNEFKGVFKKACSKCTTPKDY